MMTVSHWLSCIASFARNRRWRTQGNTEGARFAPSHRPAACQSPTTWSCSRGSGNKRATLRLPHSPHQHNRKKDIWHRPPLPKPPGNRRRG
jgi:hypothetical protein